MAELPLPAGARDRSDSAASPSGRGLGTAEIP